MTKANIKQNKTKNPEDIYFTYFPKKKKKNLVVSKYKQRRKLNHSRKQMAIYSSYLGYRIHSQKKALRVKF